MVGGGTGPCGSSHRRQGEGPGLTPDCGLMPQELCGETERVRALAEKAQKFIGFSLLVGVLEFSLKRIQLLGEPPPEDLLGTPAGMDRVGSRL